MTAALAEAVWEWEQEDACAEEDPTRVTQPALLIDPTDLARAILARIDELFDEARSLPERDRDSSTKKGAAFRPRPLPVENCGS